MFGDRTRDRCRLRRFIEISLVLLKADVVILLSPGKLASCDSYSILFPASLSSVEMEKLNVLLRTSSEVVDRVDGEFLKSITKNIFRYERGR